MTPVRLEPAALRSRVKHSTTESLRSHKHYVKSSPDHQDFFDNGNRIVFEISPYATFTINQLYLGEGGGGG